MSLRSLANSATRTINPNVMVVLESSRGYAIKPGGARVPEYDVTPIEVQVQALSYGDLQQLDGLNIQGVRRAIYAEGAIAGVIRAAQKGGDLITFPPGRLPEGDTWLCVHVLEQWDWVKIAITLQNGS